jgi:hypothetical protein
MLDGSQEHSVPSASESGDKGSPVGITVVAEVMVTGEREDEVGEGNDTPRETSNTQRPETPTFELFCMLMISSVHDPGSEYDCP